MMNLETSSLLESSRKSETEVVEEDKEEIQEGTSSASERPVDRPNAKAAVWRFFSLKNDEHGVINNQDIPACKIDKCLARVKIKHSSTSNIYSHLKVHHPFEYQAVRPSRNLVPVR